MVSAKSFALTSALFSFISSTVAYDAAGRTNVAMYYVRKTKL
jgi:hypothetical protein